MSNLGAYQDFATDAKQFGGVERYLRTIEANAVAGAAPRLYARAAVSTLVVLGGLAAIHLEAKRRLEARRTLERGAGAAREHLLASEQIVESHSFDQRHRGPRSDARTCSWCGQSGHDKGSCDVPPGAAGCRTCGFHGHSSDRCPWARR